MSDKKRQELIDSGQLDEDGNRRAQCAACGHVFTPEEVVAQAEAVNLSASTEPEED